MKTCLIISGGEKSKLNIDVNNYFVVACDKGYAYAKSENITPNLIIGDFDSYCDELPDDIEILTLPHEKDDTDTMYAVKEAIKRGYDSIEIRCALGGRPDHEYANYQTIAYCISQGCACKIISDKCDIYGIKDSATNITMQKGQLFSVFAISDECLGVSIKGSHYEVDNVCINNTFPLGQSNYAEENVVNVSVKSGLLLIMVINEREF